MGDEEDRSSLSHTDAEEQSGHAEGQVGNNVNAAAGGGANTTATAGNQV